MQEEGYRQLMQMQSGKDMICRYVERESRWSFRKSAMRHDDNRDQDRTRTGPGKHTT